jgi:2-polyprenyl-6-methoxyphenol hydroxylase-like FAD-dependent oxidoreductase
MLMWEVARERLGAQRLHVDHALAGFEQDAQGVTAHFVARSLLPSGGSLGQSRGAEVEGASRGSVRADVLIGADGIHSSVRRQLFPGEGGPKWNGAILWRGMSARPALSVRRLDDHGRVRVAEARLLPDLGGRARRPAGHQLDRGTEVSRSPGPAPRGLEQGG